MSYSSELKEYLAAVENKRQCCKAAYDAGINLRELSPCCDKDTGAWLRGAFVACGSMTDPKNQYYLSFGTSEERLKLISDVLNACGIAPSRGTRRGQPILYLRDSTKIEDFISAAGAVKYTLALMELKIIKEMSAAANRLTNADMANCSKTADASAKQVAAINKLMKTKKLPKLSKQLIETAEIRLKYPELSLDELKDMFPTPITKSGLNHRLKRLMDAADED